MRPDDGDRPNRDTIDVHVKATPQDLENGALVINNSTSIAVNGQRVKTEGPPTINSQTR